MNFLRSPFRVLVLLTIGSVSLTALGDDRQFLPHQIASSTVPASGDQNPYGVAFVPKEFPDGGAIAPGDVLVSNFNNGMNLQGTGTTIIHFVPNGTIAPNGSATVFFQSSLAGLTTALGVLKRGFILVGNVPTTDGTVGTISNGALQVVDRNGNLLEPLVDSTLLDSPWDLTIDDEGDFAHVFVSNVLSGTVSRIDMTVGSANITVVNKVQIANGYGHQPNMAALVVGPTGLAYDRRTDILYVASTDDNEIFAIPNAAHATTAVSKGAVVFSDPHLRGPLALIFAPDGRLLTANGDAVNADPTHPSEIVEFTKEGGFVAEFNVDAAEGGAFGMAAARSTNFGFNFAAVDDVPSTITVYSLFDHYDF